MIFKSFAFTTVFLLGGFGLLSPVQAQSQSSRPTLVERLNKTYSDLPNEQPNEQTNRSSEQRSVKNASQPVEEDRVESDPNALKQVARTRSSNNRSSNKSYIIRLNTDELIFLDQPVAINDTERSFFYNILKSDYPYIIQLLETTANCSTKEFRVNTNTLVDLEEVSVLNYSVTDKKWVGLDGESDQYIFDYVCNNKKERKHVVNAQSIELVLMYKKFLDDEAKKKSNK